MLMGLGRVRLGQAGFGLARRGMVRQGGAWLGVVRRGRAGLTSPALKFLRG